MKAEIISKFKESPKTKTAWWAMWLGLSTILIVPFLGVFAAVIRPIIDKASSESTGAVIGFGIGGFSLILSVAAIIVCIRAFRKGERSFILWLGFVPAILAGAFWIIMIIGEFVFPH